MRVESIAIRDLKPHPKNPRHHSDSNIAKLKDSISRFGWTNPVIATEQDRIVLAGHARIRAAELAGEETVPVLLVPLTGEQADAYLIADNRIQEETFWDEKELRAIVKDLLSITEDEAALDGLGFDPNEISVMMELYNSDVEIDVSMSNPNTTPDNPGAACPRCGHINPFPDTEDEAQH